MESLSVDITYGNALYEAAQDLDSIEQVADELKELVEVLKENPDFFRMLKSPAFPNEEKRKIAKKVFEGQVSQILLNFIYVLIDKRRMGQFFGIAKAFEKSVDERRGILSGVIYSAVEIPDEKLKKFQDQTGKLLKKNVELKNEIDTNLIGGIKIYIDGKLIDASIRRRLDDLRDYLL